MSTATQYQGYIRYILPEAAKKSNLRTSVAKQTDDAITLPPTVVTCIQYNDLKGKKSILVCSKCSYFLQDRLCKPRYFSLVNNLPQPPVPRRLQCEWPLIKQEREISFQSVTPPLLRPLHSPNSIGRHTRFDDLGLELLSARHNDSSPRRDSRNDPVISDYSNKRKCREANKRIMTTDTPPSAKKKKRRKKKKEVNVTNSQPVTTTLSTLSPPVPSPIYSPRTILGTTSTNSAPPIPSIDPTIDLKSICDGVKRDRLVSMIVDLKKEIEFQPQYVHTITTLTSNHKKEILILDQTISDLRLLIKETEITTSNTLTIKRKDEEDLRIELLAERKKNDNLSQQLSKRVNDLRTYLTMATKQSKRQQLTISKRQHTISKLQKELKIMNRATYNEGVSHGMEHQQAITGAATNQLTLFLPRTLDAKSLSKVIDDVFEIVEPTKRPRVRGNLLAQAVWQMYLGQCKMNFIEWSEEMIRRDNPYRQAEEVAKIMDLSPGQLNLSGYHALRQGIEKKNNKGKIPNGKGWLCSKYYVQQAQYAIERKAKIDMPYQMLENIDGFVFDYEKSTKYINDKVLKLAEVAKDPTQPAILIGCTLDGVRVSANVTLIIAGTKVIDPRAIDPRTGEYVSLFQSPFLCFPMKIVVCADNKSSYKEHFSDFFEFFNNIHERQIGDYPPGTFYSAWPQDGSSVWKATGRGGACKNHIEFCSYCPCKSEECASPLKIPCDDCKAAREKECFHRRVGDAATMAKYQESLDKLDLKFPFITGNPSSRFKLILRYEPDEINKENDPTNIFFEPKSNKQTEKFSERVNNDLVTLGYSCLGTMKERKKNLIKALKAIHRFEDATTGLEACTYEGALIQIKQAIPCILHLENRCGEKFIKMILKEVLQQQNKTPKQENEFIVAFEDLVNYQILGQPNRPSNWKVPVSKKEKKFVVGDLTMPCLNVRKFLNKFDMITSLAFPDDPIRKEAWDECIQLWQVIIKQANKHEDFTDEDIDSFQKIADEWGKLWLDLIPGDEGMTNYIHMVIAGHLKYYLQEWKNLYRFSQQGWEGLNSVIKSVMHNRSQGGGSAGRGEGQRKTSKVEAVVRWCLRRNFFLSDDYKLVVYLKQKFS